MLLFIPIINGFIIWIILATKMFIFCATRREEKKKAKVGRKSNWHYYNGLRYKWRISREAMAEPENNHTLHSQLIVDNPNEVWKSENILWFFLPQFTLLLLFIVSMTRFIHYILRPFNQPHFVAEFFVTARFSLFFIFEIVKYRFDENSELLTTNYACHVLFIL